MLLLCIISVVFYWESFHNVFSSMATIDKNDINPSIQDGKNVPDSGLHILARMIARNIISKRATANKKEKFNPTRTSN